MTKATLEGLDNPYVWKFGQLLLNILTTAYLQICDNSYFRSVSEQLIKNSLTNARVGKFDNINFRSVS